jgi:Carboxypeptidase regulatory-like domain
MAASARRSRVFLFFALLLFSIASAPVPAQTPTATVEGLVTDTSSAVIAGATVTVTNIATGVSRSVTADASGRYFVNNLIPAAYTISVEAHGFDKKILSGIVLQVSQDVREDIALTVGQVAETVQVQATATVTETETSSTGAVVPNKTIVEMPLSNRQFYALALLSPGAYQPAQNSSLGFRGGFNVAGSTETANNVTVNGIYDNDMAVAAPSFRPSVEAIQEFKLLTGVYSAEYGRNSGGQLVMVIKSGSNAFHGSAYEFIRNQVTDAKPFFTQLGGINPAFKQNTFGGTVGGPIIKDKTFFFYAYEGQRIRQQVTALATVPTTAMLQGQFAIPTQLYNPFTGQPLIKNSNGAYDLTKIPQYTSSAAVLGQQIASYFPRPSNNSSVGGFPSSNFDFSETRQETMNENTFRVDHTFSNSDSIYGNYNWFNDPSFEPSNSLCGSYTLPGFGCNVNQTSQLAMFSYTHIFTPNLLNEFRPGWDRLRQPRIQQYSGFNSYPSLPNIFNDPSLPLNNSGLVNTVISGYSTLGDQTNLPQDRADNHYEIIDALTWNHGAHTIHAGIDLFNYRNYSTYTSYGRGAITLNSASLQGANPVPGTKTWNHFGTTGYALADLLLGLPYEVQNNPTAPRIRELYAAYHFYVQDDWKATPYLIVNAGLRYEFNKPPSDAKNVLSNFILATGTYSIAGQGATHLYNYDYTNFAPRLGFAYQPFHNENTVLRGAFGIFYNAPIVFNGFLNNSLQYPFRNPQAFFAKAYNSSIPNSAPTLSLSNPTPVALAGGASTPAAVDPNYRTAYIDEWSLGVQRALTKAMVLETTYFGSKGTGLPLELNANQIVNGVRSYSPNYGNIILDYSKGASYYNSLQVRLQQSYNNGVAFLLAYTYGKSIDLGPGLGSTSQSSNAVPQNTFNLAAERGPSDFDVRHRLAFSPVAQLPFGRGKRYMNSGPASYLAGGWQVSGIFTFQTGRPFTVYDTATNTSLSGNLSDRPNVIANPNAGTDSVTGAKTHTVHEWFNAGAFTLQPAATFGNAGRNIVTGPGYVGLDATVARNFTLHENWALQLRVEGFNVMNHPNFLNPYTAALQYGTSSFGQIQQANNPRELQGVIKVSF